MEFPDPLRSQFFFARLSPSNLTQPADLSSRIFPFAFKHRIETIPQSVADDIKTHDRQKDTKSRPEDPGSDFDPVDAHRIAQHIAPAGIRVLNSQSNQTQA